MSKQSTPTRVNADLYRAAASVAASENRTATEQVNHWVRVGMQVERSGTLAHRAVLDVASGGAQFSSLSDTDRRIAHALVDAAIADRANAARFGAEARAHGARTVSLDEDGALIEIEADGTARHL